MSASVDKNQRMLMMACRSSSSRSSSASPPACSSTGSRRTSGPSARALIVRRQMRMQSREPRKAAPAPADAEAVSSRRTVCTAAQTEGDDGSRSHRAAPSSGAAADRHLGAEEETALGTAALSDAAERVAELVELVVDALGLDATVLSDEDAETRDGHGRGRRSRALHRPPRPDDRGCAASRTARRARVATATGRDRGSSSTRRAIAPAARDAREARPTTPPRTPCRAAARSPSMR